MRIVAFGCKTEFVESLFVLLCRPTFLKHLQFSDSPAVFPRSPDFQDKSGVRRSCCCNPFSLLFISGVKGSDPSVPHLPVHRQSKQNSDKAYTGYVKYMLPSTSIYMILSLNHFEQK